MDFYTYHYLQVHQQAFTLGWLRDYHSGEPVGPVLFLALFSSPVRHPLPGFKRNSSINSVNPGGGPSRASTG